MAKDFDSLPQESQISKNKIFRIGLGAREGSVLSICNETIPLEVVSAAMARIWRCKRVLLVSGKYPLDWYFPLIRSCPGSFFIAKGPNAFCSKEEASGVLASVGQRNSLPFNLHLLKDWNDPALDREQCDGLIALGFSESNLDQNSDFILKMRHHLSPPHLLKYFILDRVQPRSLWVGKALTRILGNIWFVDRFRILNAQWSSPATLSKSDGGELMDFHSVQKLWAPLNVPSRLTTSLLGLCGWLELSSPAGEVPKDRLQQLLGEMLLEMIPNPIAEPGETQ